MRKKGKNQKKKTTEPVAVTNKSGSRMPRTITSKNGTYVSHVETYGVGVTGGTDFSVFDSISIQPGLTTYSRGSPLGQWLPQIAQNFDNYEIQSLKFKYRAACSTLTSGLVIFGLEPNPEGVVPKTYQELRNMHSVDGSVHSNLEFNIGSKVKKELLIRKTNVVNLPTYDAGKVYICTVGVPVGTVLGFVDVEYRVRLFNPQSSLTSSEPVPVVSLKPLPLQRWTSLPQGNYNHADNSDGAWNGFFGDGSLVSVGASLASVVNDNYLALDISYDGCKYKCPARSGFKTIQIAKAGRYRLTFDAKFNFEDLKLFCAAPFIQRKSLGVATTPALCTRKVYADIQGDTTVELPVRHWSGRGFTGTALNDPNPATDVFPVMSWEIDVPYDQDEVIIMIGVLTYNSVSTTTATIIGVTNIGKPVVELEYLGVLI